MADLFLKLRYGQEANLGSVAIENGALRVTTDTRKLYADINNVRVPLGAIVTGYTEAQILATTAANALPKIYMSSDTFALFYFDTEAESGAGAWTQVGANVALADRATADASGNVITTTYETKADATDKYNTLVAQISAINSFEIRLLSSAADLANASHAQNIIYFVPANAIPTNPDSNVYDEYIWVITTPADPEAQPPVEEVGHFEKIGTTETDLTNYYTKSEFNSIVGTLDPSTQGYVTIDARISEIVAQLGAFNASTATGFVSVEGRFTADENRITELEGKFGAFNDTTATGFQTVEQRFTADEAATTEVNAKLGNMLASTDTNFVSVEDRLTALETDTTDATAVAEINAKLGNYADSTDNDFVSVEDRFTEIEGKIGNMADSTSQDFQTIEERLSAEETATSRFDAELGALDPTVDNYVTVADRLTAEETATARLDAELGTLDSTDANYQTVAQRLTTTEANDAELAAQLGNLDSTVANYVTVADRLTAEETATARLDAELGTLDSTDANYQTVAQRLTALETDTAGADAVAEINAKLGNMLDSTDNNFISVEDRLQAEESATARLDAELGALDSTAVNYVPVSTRLSTAESDIDELEAKFGAYAASSAQGFTTVEARFTSDEADIEELQKQLGLDYPASTATGFKSVNTRLGELITAVGNINKFDIRIVQTLPATTAGESYVLYFVPIAQGADNNNGHTQYVEYMWIKTSQEGQPNDGYYEEIGITEADLDEYYKATEIDAKLGSYDSSTISTKGTVQARLDEIEAKFGAYAASSAASGFATVENRFAELEAELGALDSTAANYVTVATRLTTAEAEAAELHAQIGNLDSTVQGYQTIDARISAIEGGAVTQSEDTDDAQKPILVSGGSNNDEVEYVTGVTVNADDNSITGDIGNLTTVNSTDVNADTVTSDSVVLGDATLTFDSSTGALVINF